MEKIFTCEVNKSKRSIIRQIFALGIVPLYLIYAIIFQMKGGKFDFKTGINRMYIKSCDYRFIEKTSRIFNHAGCETDIY